jgi:hypothetical protein
VGTAAAPKHHRGVVHRFTCARIGHYWATDGTGRHGVCVRCGKHSEPVQTRVPAAAALPAQDLSVPMPAIPPPLPEAALDAEQDAAGVVLPAEIAASAEQAITEELSEPRALSAPKVASVTLAVVGLAVLGGAAYLAFSRRKRRSRWL